VDPLPRSVCHSAIQLALVQAGIEGLLPREDAILALGEACNDGFRLIFGI